MIEKKYNKICVVLKAFDHFVLESAVDNIIRIAKQEKVVINGPIPLPTKRIIWTVNRSVHIYTTSKEQFEKRVHKRLFYIDANAAFIDAIGRHVLPSGVEVKVVLGGNK